MNLITPGWMKGLTHFLPIEFLRKLGHWSCKRIRFWAINTQVVLRFRYLRLENPTPARG